MGRCPQDPPGTVQAHSDLRSPSPSPLPPESKALSPPGQLHLRGRSLGCLSGGDDVGRRSCLPNHGWETGRLEGRASLLLLFTFPTGRKWCRIPASHLGSLPCAPSTSCLALSQQSDLLQVLGWCWDPVSPWIPMFPTLPSRHPPLALSLSALAFLFSLAVGQEFALTLCLLFSLWKCLSPSPGVWGLRYTTGPCSCSSDYTVEVGARPSLPHSRKVLCGVQGSA